MSKCSACIIAAVNPRTGRFNVGCFACEARSLANEPAFFESVEAESVTPAYRARLQMVFGDRWKEGHASVRAWSERMGSHKAPGAG